MNHFIFRFLLFIAIVNFQPFVVKAQWEALNFDKQYLNERPQQLSLKNSFVENETYRDWDLTYNCLKLTIDPAVMYLSGSVVFEFVSKKDGLSSVTIDLDNALTIKSVIANRLNLSFSQQKATATIHLASVLKKNERGAFTVTYSGEPSATGLGSIFSTIVGGNVPCIATLSEPYGAKDWWPCKQSLEDKIDSIDVIVETPMEYRTASNGVLVSDSVLKGKRTCHWKHRHPIATYLVFFSSTDYDTYSDYAMLDDGTKVEILNYVYRINGATARQQTPVTADYIEFFSRKFIDYPFKNEKYGHAQFSWGGGMEHQTMSSMWGFSADLIAHELAHQWFGDYITCGTWGDIWLNEGFATYLEAMTYEKFEPEYWPEWKQSALAWIVSQPGGTVYCNEPDDIDRIFSSRLSYYKGAYVLHMLRGQLGDSLFFAGMKRYLNDPQVTNGFATTDLFRENMEKAADTTLTKFFDDWVFGEGYPNYEIDWVSVNGQLSISVSQTPSVLGGPFFEMKLPVTVLKNGESETFWLNNYKQSQQYTIASFPDPDNVVFDQDNWVLCKYQIENNPFSSFQNLKSPINVRQHGKMISIQVPEIESATCSFFDVTGRKIFSTIWRSSAPEVSIASLSPGVYIMELVSGGNSFSSKFSVR